MKKCNEVIWKIHNRTSGVTGELRCGDYFAGTTQLCTKCLHAANLRRRLLAIRHTDKVLKAQV